MRLIINGIEIDLSGSQIKQTKQTNDIGKIETRQTNYTNAFDLEKTPNNVEALEFLSLPGNLSNAPYKKNEAYLYSDTGECFVYRGWVQVKETTSVYKVWIYDGNLELYKAIENTSLSQLDLSELKHFKTVETVISSWTNEYYRYLLTDYNGKIAYGSSNEKINIDYLVPSVRTKYLWDKVFEYAGFTYEGSVFQTEEFLNHWMTFPKGLSTGDADYTVLDAEFADYKVYASPQGPTYYAKATDIDINELLNFNNNIFMRVADSGNYRIDITGTLSKLSGLGNFGWRLLIGKNTEALMPHQIAFPIAETIVENGESFTISFVFQNIQQYDSFSIAILPESSYLYVLDVEASSLDVQLVKLNPNNIDFEDAFIDFQIKDFISEVLIGFGLSMFKEKYTNHYVFLTSQERLQTAEVEEWDDHTFVKKISETYELSEYAQLNILKYKYNDQESNYNDGVIKVNNVNLSDARVLYSSHLYSPEKDFVDYFGFNLPTCKLFDKEYDEETETYKYKALDKRFIWGRSQEVNINVTIGSEILSTEQTVNKITLFSYWKLSWADIVNEYYSATQSILQRSNLTKGLVALSEVAVSNIDFKKIYFVKKLSKNYLLNKINSYVPGKLTQCELIEIDKSQFSIYVEPFIHFGLGSQEKTISIGDTINIWVSTVYKDFESEINLVGAVKISNYQYQFLATGPLTQSVKVTVTINSNIYESNSLLLTVDGSP